MKLKIMTYNIAGGRDHTVHGEKPFVHPEACTEVIRAEAPDICGLNEVDYKLPRSNYVKMAKFIGDSIGYESAFAPAVTWWAGTYGNGFVSKYHIVESEVFPIPDPLDRSEDTYYETRVILHALVDFDGKEVDVFVTHFGLAKAEAQNAVTILCKLIKAATHPVILMGDLNLVPDDPILAPVYELLDDTFAVYADKSVYTWPSYIELCKANEVPKKIDFIFVSRDIKVEKVEIPASDASDHKPYVAYIEI